VLHILKPTKKQLISLILVATLVYFLIYAAQYVLYPSQLVFSKMKPDRAKVRISLPGFAFLLFTIVYCTYNYLFISKKARMLVTSLTGSVFLVFLSTRILIASTYFMQVLILLQGKAKGLIVLMLLGGAFLFVGLPLINTMDPQLINGIISRTKNDQDKADEYIRVQAFEYYLAKMKKQPVTYITGNGQPTGGKNFSSKYSEITNYEKELGFFLDDLGYFGAFYRYGIFFLLFILAMLIKAWKVFNSRIVKNLTQTDDRMKLGYIGYYLLLMALVSVTIPVFLTNGDAIFCVCTCLYLIDYEIAHASEARGDEHEQTHAETTNKRKHEQAML